MYAYILCYSNVKFEFFSFIPSLDYSADLFCRCHIPVYITLINFETDLGNFLILLFVKLSYLIIFGHL